MEGNAPDGHFDKRIPCAFLENKRCLVYEDRPATSCRSYFVVTPQELCSAEESVRVGMVNTEAVQGIMIEQAALIQQQMGLQRMHGDVPSKLPNPMRLMIGALPRMVYLWLESWNMKAKERVDFLRSQPWPTKNNMRAWREGQNPFRKQGEK